MAVDVVQELEVVEVEDDQRHRPAVAFGALDLVLQPLVEDAVVVQACEPVGLGLVQEPDPVLRVLERERRHLGELADEHELVGGELHALAQPVRVERADRAVVDDQRHRDDRLGLVLGRPGHDGDAGVALRGGDVRRLAVLDHPAGQALPQSQRRGHDLVGPLVAGVDGHDLAGDLVDAVDRERVDGHEPVELETRSARRARPASTETSSMREMSKSVS